MKTILSRVKLNTKYIVYPYGADDPKGNGAANEGQNKFCHCTPSVYDQGCGYDSVYGKRRY